MSSAREEADRIMAETLPENFVTSDCVAARIHCDAIAAALLAARADERERCATLIDDAVNIWVDREWKKAGAAIAAAIRALPGDTKMALGALNVEDDARASAILRAALSPKEQSRP